MDRRYLASLLSDFHSGSIDAFAAVYLSSVDDLYEKAFRKTCDVYAVQDFLHTFYTALYQKMADVHTPEEFHALFRQLKQQPLSSLKKNIAHTSHSIWNMEIKEQQLLDILHAVDAPACIHPLVQIDDYNNYRRIRHRLLCTIEILAAVFILSLPFFLYVPSIKEESAIYHNRPAVEITIGHHFFPIRSVTAAINDIAMPVYENADGTYTAIVNTSGTMVIRVTTAAGRYAVLETETAGDPS